MNDERFKEYTNEIPFNTLSTWSRTLLQDARWENIGWTGTPSEPYRHWACYPELEGVLKQLWDFVHETIKEDGLDLTLQRTVMNLYNHGDSSWLHVDSQNSDEWTVIVFMNEYWNLNWGGDFVLVENNEILKAFAATPGKFVLFKGNLLHGARPVSREAPYPRFGIAFQSKSDSNIQRLSPINIPSVHSAL